MVPCNQRIQRERRQERSPVPAHGAAHGASHARRLGFGGALRAEWCKVWSVTSTYVLLVLAIVFFAVNSLMMGWLMRFVESQGDGMPLGNEDLWAAVSSGRRQRAPDRRHSRRDGAHQRVLEFVDHHVAHGEPAPHHVHECKGAGARRRDLPCLLRRHAAGVGMRGDHDGLVGEHPAMPRCRPRCRGSRCLAYRWRWRWAR